MKKILYIIIALTSMFLLNCYNLIFAQENSQLYDNKTVNIYFFWGEGCPHCEKEKEFLSKMKSKYKNLSIKDFEVWHNRDNGKLLQKISDKLNIRVGGVPFTIIGDKNVTGYLNDLTTGKTIEKYINDCIENSCKDVVGELLECCETDNTNTNNETKTNGNGNGKITLPYIGEIDLANYSLPVITIIFGAIDGFNPCAMWILLFLISMLLGMKDRKKMWILGSSFILASGMAYFLFISAWLNIILFFGFLFWIKFLIGIFAISGGGYNIFKFFEQKKKSGCSVVGEEKRNKLFDKIKKIVQGKNFALSLIGICILAFAVNIVELLCSAGLPAVYTQILALNELPKVSYYLYILLYIFFFMLDDMIVFVVSMITLQTTGLTTKYTKYSHLIGGVLMIIIGILLIFKHDLLMF